MQTNYKIIILISHQTSLSEMSEKRGILVENELIFNLELGSVLKNYGTSIYIARAMAYVANVANTIISSNPESFGDCKRETFNPVTSQVFAGNGRVKSKKPYEVWFFAFRDKPLLLRRRVSYRPIKNTYFTKQEALT